MSQENTPFAPKERLRLLEKGIPKLCKPPARSPRERQAGLMPHPALATLAVGIFQIIIAACSSQGIHAPLAQAPDYQTQLQAQAALLLEQEKPMHNTIKKSIDELVAADFADVQFLNNALAAHLQEDLSDNPHVTVLRSGEGRFAGLSVRNVELRAMKDDASRALLLIELADPGPEASAFVQRFWPKAEFTPARPHAPDSSAYWSIEQNGVKVEIGQPSDRTQITSIVMDRMP